MIYLRHGKPLDAAHLALFRGTLPDDERQTFDAFIRHCETLEGGPTWPADLTITLDLVGDDLTIN